MSMMNGVPDYCPRCEQWGFCAFGRADWYPSTPARPAMFFGLIKARPAKPARFRFTCRACDFSDSYEIKRGAS
jgi:ribosomal protein L44E